MNAQRPLTRRSVAVFGTLFAAAFVLLSATRSSAAELPKALVPATVEVPSSLRTTPFDQDRVLMVPPGFKISVLARIPGARFMMPLTTGEILVAEPSDGCLSLVKPQAGGTASALIKDLHNPQGMALHQSDHKLYLYVGESNQVTRFLLAPGATSASDKTVIVPNLPDSSSPELGGSYRHELKNLVIGPDNKLYVDIASSTNADPVDTTSNPVRSAIYQYDLDGTNGRIFAHGIRNAEGLAFVPGTNELWAVVNETDDIVYPFHNSWQGSGSIDYGKRITSYVDDHPPDELIHVKDGANYGWPFANPNPDTPNGLDNMPFAPNYETNPDWTKYPESVFTRTDKGIQAHSAPLGIAFLQDSKVPEPFREGIAIALHGSWNRSRKTGYKVIFFPWQDGRPGPQIDLVTGWLDDRSQNLWGRPVDVKPAEDGSLLISDDYSGTIYRLAPSGGL
ncbi:MAG: sugar dehydrogenase [Verrucomicrobia bacterium]|nr:sugar dehydrogenase [Verrucomicrobiota bacterium]